MDEEVNFEALLSGKVLLTELVSADEALLLVMQIAVSLQVLLNRV